MSDLNWFQKKWGLGNPPIEELYQKVIKIENRVKILEDENVGLTNELYRLENSLDARIDILTLENWVNKDV